MKVKIGSGEEMRKLISSKIESDAVFLSIDVMAFLKKSFLNV